MNNFTRFAILIGLLSISQLAYSDSITDTYNTGDTLTATMLNNIKSAVNDNDSRMDSLEAADLINRITALEAALAAHIANVANPHAVTKAQVGLADLENIRVNYTATTAPTVDDDINSGYSVGSVWIDVTEDRVFVSVDSTSGIAVWKQLSNQYYAIGDTGPAGGIVFHIFDGGLHGLEASPADQSTTAGWGCSGTTVSDGGDFVQEIGMGVPNTLEITAGCATPGIAARLASDFELNGFTDWFLPSKIELDVLFGQRTIVGGFLNSAYWSSSEASGANSSTFAWFRNFGTGNEATTTKTGLLGVRAIRAF